MKSYIILINERYFAGFEESEIELDGGTGGWYQEKKYHTIEQPILSDKIEYIEEIEGNTNLTSVINQILKWEKTTKKIIDISIRVRNWNC